jgi:hypothetical protein
MPVARGAGCPQCVAGSSEGSVPLSLDDGTDPVPISRESAPVVTRGEVMIIVCVMLSCKFNSERYNHDPQTVYQKHDDIIAKYGDFEFDAQTIFSGPCT